MNSAINKQSLLKHRQSPARKCTRFAARGVASWLLSTVMMLLAVPASTAATTSYHIGNSLTWDNQPLGIAAIANQHGFDHTAGHHIRCGWSLNGILGDPTNICVSPVTEFGTFGNALPNHEWNAVTMQPHPHVGFNSTLLSDVTSILTLIDMASTNGANADTTYYIYSGWPEFPDLQVNTYQSSWSAMVPDINTTPTVHARQYYEHLINRVRNATDATVNFVPVGEVLYELDIEMQAGQIPGFTDITQFYRDTTHLTRDLGRYTTGVTTFATLFDTDPAGSTKPAGFYGDDSAFSPALYSAIHGAVWDVVSTNAYNGSLYWPADFQSDGFVDDTDLAILESSLGNNGLGDTDGDGDTDGRDFLRWQQKFDGAGVPLVGSVATVPEPPSITLLLMALVGVASAAGPLRRRGVAILFRS